MVYGKDAKTNKLCDQIDIYNFENVNLFLLKNRIH